MGDRFVPVFLPYSILRSSQQAFADRLTICSEILQVSPISFSYPFIMEYDCFGPYISIVAFTVKFRIGALESGNKLCDRVRTETLNALHLLSMGVDIDGRRHRGDPPPPMTAVRISQEEMVDFLIKKGANVHAKKFTAYKPDDESVLSVQFTVIVMIRMRTMMYLSDACNYRY